jgi:uncharacterized protein
VQIVIPTTSFDHKSKLTKYLIMKRILIAITSVVLIIYFLLCGFLYFNQEKIIFRPDVLPKDYTFSFAQSFEEINIKTRDNTNLNGLLFKAENSKGLVFYLHGNSGAVNSFGEFAKIYTDLNYDVFFLDYRGFGKSEGIINSQKDLLDDVQIVYDNFKSKYSEDKIIIVGYSIGTGPATFLASSNNPKKLILHAPYYSLVDIMQQRFPVFPTVLLKYPLPTYEYMQSVKAPITVFHGTSDNTIPYNSSLKLQELFKQKDKLITLEGESHAGIMSNPQYLEILKKELE